MCATDFKNASVVEALLFPKPEESRSSRFMSMVQVDMSLRVNGQVLMMFAYLRVKNDVVASDIQVVCEFPDVFPEDIGDFLIEREVEFVIDLVSGTSHVSMAPYRMFASESSELKKDGSLRLCVDYQQLDNVTKD